jgi:hypothetical protein
MNSRAQLLMEEEVFYDTIEEGEEQQQGMT